MADKDITVEVDWKRLDAAMKRAPMAFYKHFKRRLGEHHRRFRARFKRENLRGKHGREGVHRRTGHLSRHIAGDVRGRDLKTLALRSYIHGTPYARILEHGGVIRPKTAKWLTVPLKAAKTKAGVARASARHFEGTFFRRSKAGNLILWGLPLPSSKEPVPLFVLKKQVKIPPLLGFFKVFDRMKNSRSKALNAVADDVMRELDE